MAIIAICINSICKKNLIYWLEFYNKMGVMMSLINLPVVLASSSPRRHELLQQVAIAHQQCSVEIDETRLPNELATTYIERMVSEKSQAMLSTNHLNLPNNYLLITADTIGVLQDGQVLVKPMNFDDAVQMWQKMSHTTHQVWTAVQVSLIQLIANNPIIIWQKQQTVKTEVEFIQLSFEQMQAYWETGEPCDKAGGYAIQGQGGAWVKKIYGSYSNVVGLPLVETIDLLQQAQQMTIKQKIS